MDTGNLKKLPPELEGLDARSRILKVAIKLFANQGFHATTTRQISHDASVNISLISYYFGGKDALYKAAFREFADLAERNLKQVIAMTRQKGLTRESFREALEKIIIQMVDDHINHPDLKTLISQEIQAGMPMAKDVFENTMTKIIEEFSDLIERAKQAGIVRADIHPIMMMMLMSQGMDSYLRCMKCETTLSRTLPRLPAGRDQLIRQMKVLFLEGALLS